MYGESLLFLRYDPQLFCLDLVLQVSCPGLEEELCGLWVENLLLWDHGLRVHRQRGFLGEQTCVEGVLREEGLAELRVPQFLVVVLIKSLHKEA